MPDPVPADYLLIGKLLKPHGLRGDMKAEMYVDDLDELSAFSGFFVRDSKSPGGYRELPLSGLKYIGNNTVASIAGVDIDQAEKMRNTEIFVLKREVPRPRKDQYYIGELEGCAVAWNGGVFGKVAHVFEIAGRFLLTVRMENGKDLVVPFNDRYIEKVDTDSRTITARTIDELL